MTKIGGFAAVPPLGPADSRAPERRRPFQSRQRVTVSDFATIDVLQDELPRAREAKVPSHTSPQAMEWLICVAAAAAARLCEIVDTEFSQKIALKPCQLSAKTLLEW